MDTFNGLFEIKNALPHRGCQKSLQNLYRNPDCKILSMCENPDDSGKIYLEVVKWGALFLEEPNAVETQKYIHLR